MKKNEKLVFVRKREITSASFLYTNDGDEIYEEDHHYQHLYVCMCVLFLSYQESLEIHEKNKNKQITAVDRGPIISAKSCSFISNYFKFLNLRSNKIHKTSIGK